MFPNPFGSWAEQPTYPTWGTEPTPSMFGALPYTGITVSDLVTFTFSSSTPSLFNSAVVGFHDNQVHYRILTGDEVEGYSTITNSNGSKIALIEWRSPPMVELRNNVPKQKCGHWLKLTPDKRLAASAVYFERTL
ncbi:hypothetical protein H0H87_003416 [Tephrocybe sp. NHM501043]|nr:hypothetical protein H0H87_003416 [Tephrocybe sp. NHM501043]